jgi:HSP20 family molecular chaperone IbpA
MEEKTNNTEEKIEVNEEQPKKSDRFVIKLLLGFLAIFLGAFAAFFFAFSTIAKNTNIAYAFNNDSFFKTQDEFFNNADKEFDRIFKENQMVITRLDKNLLKPDATIRTEENPKEYKITVNLKTYGNDEKNINFKTDKNRVSISAKYENNKNKNSYSSSSFYESFGLPGKIDNSKIVKERKGDNLVIIIPKN